MLGQAIKNIIILAHIVGMLLYLNVNKLQPHVPVYKQQTVLLVTAHPDDEAMFFGPTVGWALKNQHPIHLLCLSNGNSTGIGEKRQSELVNSVMLMGMSPYNMSIINSPELPDSMEQRWDTEVIKGYIAEEIERTNADIIVSFDEGGVSNHTNHIQVAKAVREQGTAEGKEVWQLRTIPFLRKYMGNLDIFKLFLYGRSPVTIFSNPEMHFRSWVAMYRGHKSQMKWFRYGWLLVSRYMFINDYTVLGRALNDLPGFLSPKPELYQDL